MNHTRSAIPAKAGTHLPAARATERWTPAFAGEAFDIVCRHERLCSCYEQATKQSRSAEYGRHKIASLPLAMTPPLVSLRAGRPPAGVELVKKRFGAARCGVLERTPTSSMIEGIFSPHSDTRNFTR